MRIGNWPLLLRALEHIITHPEQYDQTTWRSDCGAYRCLAGWIAHFGGYRDAIPPLYAFQGERHARLNSDSPVVTVEEAALVALDLDPEIYGGDMELFERSPEMDDLAGSLFDDYHDMVDILTTVRDLAKADGVTPTPLIVEEMLHAGILTKWDTF